MSEMNEGRMIVQMERPTCPVCHSKNVYTNATAYWNDGWEMSDGTDGVEGGCMDCHAIEITFVWVDVEEKVS